MKNILFLFLFSVFLFSCNDKKVENKISEEETVVSGNTSLKTYQGEFIYTPEAAVFKGNSFIYGVHLNDVAKDLAKKVEAVKKENYDMVPVIVRGEVTPKAEGAEGWDEILTITEIVNVSDTPTKADIELKENKS